MAEQENGNGNGNGNGNATTTKRLVRAGVASALSAAITYGIRKAAPAIRQKLQQIGEDGTVPETLGKAKDAVGEKVEAATSAVTDRLPVGGNSGQSRSSGSLSEKELESRLKERAQNRKTRQKASTS